MIVDQNQLFVTMEQLGRALRALGDLKQNVLSENPALFGVLAESCLDDLERLRNEINGYLNQMKSAG